MAAANRQGRRGDPFGNGIAERVWRRLAGAGLAVVLAAAGLTFWETDLLPWVLVGTFIVYALGVPTSWVVTQQGGNPVLRHVLAAVVVGLMVAVVLSRLHSLLEWWFVALFSVGVGVPLAALAAWSGIALPARWVRPVAILGLLVTTILLPFLMWLEWRPSAVRRPPAPHDFVVVHEPDAVRQHFGSAYALALRSSNRPIRLVTTIFDGEPNRGCVIVTPDTPGAEPRSCAKLDLIR